MSALAVLLCISFCARIEAAESRLAVASGGKISFTFYHSNLKHAGLSMLGASAVDNQTDAAGVLISPQSSLVLATSEGFFESLSGGALSTKAGLKVVAGHLQLSSENMLLVPKSGSRDTLWLTDAVGKRWFYLDYGHFEQQGQMLHGRYMDMRIAADLADAMGQPALQGYLIGAASLETRIQTPLATLKVPELSQAQGITPFCPVVSPNWPTLEGFDADIAMLKIDEVSEVARLNGRVAIVPTAYFENIGSADVPWFAQFADTRQVDACCTDQGDGACAPYGNDQSGLLVYHLYRFMEGRLEQLGQSHVKHAFNSVNTDTDAGSVECRAPNRSGRVVPSGCEDLYQAHTNAHQAYLGPRDEIVAHTASWIRGGSIWDRTGPLEVPDGNCDYMPDPQLYGGQVPCMAPVVDALDRRMSVPEPELLIAGARYFIEAWYLVRDDINVFNSFGRKEIKPRFQGYWTFTAASEFRQGPVIEDYSSLQQAELAGKSSAVSASKTDIVDSGEGQLQLVSTASKLAEGQWQYDMALMNIDFDRAIDEFAIPVPTGMNVLATAYFDGDDSALNNWTASLGSGELRFQAPAGVSLKWGSLVSFRFVADRAPTEADAELVTAVAGDPQMLTIKTLSGVPLIFLDGFEQ